MKKMKKLLSILVAATMTMAMAAPSFADDEPAPTEPVKVTYTGTNPSPSDGHISISGAISGKTYTIYQMFGLSVNQDKTAYSYTISPDDPWYDFVSTAEKDHEEEEEGADYHYVKLGNPIVENGKTTYYVSAGQLSEATAAEFAKKALEHAKGNSDIKALANGVANEIGLEFNSLPLGYYLVDSSVGALCGLNSTDHSVAIREKNETVPEMEKKIDSTKDAASAMIGEKINYTVTIKAKEGAENYVLHDKMDEGLDFNNDIKIAGLTEKNADNPNGDYTVRTGTDANGFTFEVEFEQSYLNTITTDTDIVVTYSATLNAKAVVEGDNKNTAYLSYGDETDITNKTPDQVTTTKTWQFDVLKYDGAKFAADAANKDSLAGATFTLSANADGSNPITLVKDSATETYKVCALEDHEGVDHQHVTTVTTTANGAFKVAGLKAGTYYLTETVAPDGYNKLAAPVEIRIAENADQEGIGVDKIAEGGVVVVGKDENDAPTYKAPLNKQVEVENKAGSLLPSTGGIGTTIFYAAGIILMAGAVFFVVRRRRA